MKIGHAAIWARDIELLKNFYERYFNGRAGNKYLNEERQFSSYFIQFETGARLERMHMPSLSCPEKAENQQYTGLAHIAFSAGSEENVRLLTERLKKDGYMVVDGPRTTGDGYYESVVLDPENNRVEITV
jgi:lactoylglutathione lyase